MSKVTLPKKSDKPSEAPVKCMVESCTTSTKFRTLKEHMLKHHHGYVVLFCTLPQCTWSCFSSDLRCFINHQIYKHQVIFKGKAHDFSEATGFMMGLDKHPVRKDRFGKVIHSEACKISSLAKTADSRASSRIRTQV